MNARHWNGDDDRPHGSSTGQPEPWKCLDCPAAGKGYVSRGRHWYASQHHIVAGFDPRAKDAPRAVQKQPARAQNGCDECGTEMYWPVTLAFGNFCSQVCADIGEAKFAENMKRRGFMEVQPDLLTANVPSLE